MTISKILQPTEYQIQEAVIKWASYHPILSQYLIAIENERKTYAWQGRKRMLRGVRSGVSDLFLAYPCSGYHGLWLELKIDNKKKAKVSLNQASWLKRMKDIGYAAFVAYGYEEATKILSEYVNGELDDD